MQQEHLDVGTIVLVDPKQLNWQPTSLEKPVRAVVTAPSRPFEIVRIAEIDNLASNAHGYVGRNVIIARVKTQAA